jgi:hypothetical protein
MAIAVTLACLLAFLLIPDEDGAPVMRANSACKVLAGMAGVEGTAEWKRVAAECELEKNPPSASGAPR